MRAPHSPIRPLIVSFVLSVATAAFAQAPSRVADKAAFDRNFAVQIAILHREKATRSPAEQKMDSAIVQALRAARGEKILQGLPKYKVPNVIRIDGTVDVELSAVVTGSLLDRLRIDGAQIFSSLPKYGSITARLPASMLEDAAMLPGVHSVKRPGAYTTNSGNAQTEGDTSMTTDILRLRYGIGGTGTKVGVISDSNDYQEQSQASGDLPATVDVPNGNNGRPATGEGSAMMEIVHDVAPNSSIAFNTAGGSEAQFAQHYHDLFDAGCQIIADDVSFFDEPAFQDGPIAHAIDEITGAGGLCFAAAANDGNKRSNTASIWEGDYVDSGVTHDGHPLHAWSGTTTSNNLNSDGEKYLGLQWNEPWGNATSDYDLFLTDGAGNVVASSTTNNAGGDPLEHIYQDAKAGLFAYAEKYSGTNRVLRLNHSRGALQFATDGQVVGHSGSDQVVSCAAINAAMNPARAFNAGDVTTAYSSDGKRRIYYNYAGTQISNGLTAASALFRLKPDVAGPDGVATTVPKFQPFYGTSASAPHCAALAALLREFAPDANQYTIKYAILQSTIDILTQGWDRDSGSGAVSGLGAIKKLMQDKTKGFTPSEGFTSPTKYVTFHLDLGRPAPPNGLTFVPVVTGDTGAFSYGNLTVLGGQQTADYNVFGSGSLEGTISLQLTEQYSQAVVGKLTVTNYTTPHISYLSVSPNPVTGNAQGVSGLINLTDKVSKPTVIELQSSDTSMATVPATVTVSTNFDYKTFPVTTKALKIGGSCVIRARRQGTGEDWTETTLTVKSPQPKTIFPSITKPKPGDLVEWTVRLTGPAPDGGFLVGLVSSDTRIVSVPRSLTFAAGQTSLTFRTVVGSTQVGKSVRVSVRTNNETACQSSVSVQVPEVSDLSLRISTIHGGETFGGSVTLASAAPAGGTLVNLGGYGTGFSLPSSVLVHEGETSAAFSGTTDATRTSHTVKLWAKTTSVTKSAVLTVNP